MLIPVEMFVVPDLLLSLPLFFAFGFLGDLIKGLFGGSSSKSKTSLPGFAMDSGNLLHSLAKEMMKPGNPFTFGLEKAGGPSFTEQLSGPGMNWYDALTGGTSYGSPSADGSMLMRAGGDTGEGIDNMFDMLAPRNARRRARDRKHDMADRRNYLAQKEKEKNPQTQQLPGHPDFSPNMLPGFLRNAVGNARR